MRPEDLDLRELLDYSPQGGPMHFAGQRVLLVDAMSLGMLRGELFAILGRTGARGVLTRLGYAHGVHTARALRTAFPWDSEAEWRRAGGRLHTLQGLMRFEALPDGPGAPFAHAVWHDSYEAEQHLLHFGQSDEPVCWSLAGFASGYLSAANERKILVLEDRCRGKGDAICRMVGRPREEWEPAVLEKVQPFFENACLEAALSTLAGELKKTERKLRSRRRDLGDDEGGDAGARAPAMRRVLEMASRVAAVDSTVLLLGESGVGKERLARTIHAESARAGGPFVAVNLGAVPETLMESEIFGHAKGAFTGATADRPGLFEAAHGGTLLLDEIGELPLPMQVKLLRVLQERSVRRVGENRDRPVDARVIAATNRDLGAEVAAGRFRQDLYYRLRVIELKIPPLRERKEDLLALARLFVAEQARRLGRKISGLTPDALAKIIRYPWPGNVRELENAIERAVVLARGERVEEEDLPDEVRAAQAAPPSPGAGTRPLDEVEREHILAAVASANGNKTRAAQELGIGIATLHRKLKQYDGTRLE
jgi:DNA-binding NtrC family response regulator